MTDNLLIKINPWLTAIDGTLGVHAVHSGKGVVFSQNGDMPFYLASTYKIPIAVQCLKMVDSGQLKLDQWVDITMDDLPKYSPILDSRHFSYPGVKLHLQNLLRLAMEYSDNTASDVILKLAGGIPAVQNFLAEAGFAKEISIDLSLKDSFDEDNDDDTQDFGTPAAMVRLLDQIIAGKLLSPASTKFLVECMQRCKTGEGRIRALLPPRTLIASKTGTVTGVTHDIAVINLPENNYQLLLGIFIKGTTVPLKESENVIANIAKVIFDEVVS